MVHPFRLKIDKFYLVFEVVCSDVGFGNWGNAGTPSSKLDLTLSTVELNLR